MFCWHVLQACVPRDPDRCMWRRGRWCRCSVLKDSTIRSWSGPVTSSPRGIWIWPRTCSGGRDCWFLGRASWSSTLPSATRGIIPVLWGKVQMYLLNIPQKKITQLQLKSVGRYEDQIHANDLHSMADSHGFPSFCYSCKYQRCRGQMFHELHDWLL